jgi:competence protein ComFC
LCPRCASESVRFVQPWCPSCGVPTRLTCQCHSKPETLSQIRSVGPFERWLRGAVIQCKYHGEWARVSELAPLLAEVCDTLHPFDALVPVPLHPSRLRQRGFNQSLLLAYGVAEILSLPVEDCLLRTRRTDSQARLPAVDRAKNVSGAIAVRQESETAGRTFVLIDDVITTGATLSECASTLLQVGASSVKAATICREM